MEKVQSDSTNTVFGIAIIILAFVMTGIVCVMGNVRIPFVSSYFAPTPVPSGITMEIHGVPTTH